MSTEKPPVEHVKGVNGLDKIILRESRRRSAEVYLYGGHLTSWKNEHGEELLFLSSKKRFSDVFTSAEIYAFTSPETIHLGFCSLHSSLQKLFVEEFQYAFLKYIPVWNPSFSVPLVIHICFGEQKMIYLVQFSNLGPLEAHGFARNRFWSIDSDPPPLPMNSSTKAFTDLILKPSEEEIKTWPHKYEYRLRVALGPEGDLTIISRVRNTNADGKPFTFTFAHHTYFSVSDISEVRVEGLETLDYLDNLRNRERSTEQGDAITFESEFDRIYLRAPSKVAILDHEKKRTFVIRSDGFSDAVVWNPWDKKSKSIADLGDEEYKRFVCVETAVIEKPITLKPGEEWKGRLLLSAVPSSYCSGQLDPQKVLEG